MSVGVRWGGFAEKMQKIELRFFEEKMKNASVFLVVSVLTLSVLQNAYGFSGQGSGTEQDPYIITDVFQLQEMNNDLDAWYELGNDIDASDTKNWNDGAGFIPVGNAENSFTGTFDGNNFSITDLYINRNQDYVGLFGKAGGIIQDVRITNLTILSGGSSCIGGLVGRHVGRDISNVHITGHIEGYDFVGGRIVSIFS